MVIVFSQRVDRKVSWMERRHLLAMIAMKGFKYDSKVEAALGIKAIAWLQRGWIIAMRAPNSINAAVIEIDLGGLDEIFDKHNNVDQERICPSSNYWTDDNPYPVNLLDSAQELLKAFDDEDFSKRFKMSQSRQDLESVISKHDNNNFIVSACWMADNDEMNIVYLRFEVYNFGQDICQSIKLHLN
jgi:hypothetical protein